MELKFDHPESTFNKNFPNAGQVALELKYKELWLKALEEGTAKGLSRRTIWEAFTGSKPHPQVKTWGVLLASDVPKSLNLKNKSEWGEGRPLFKVRFTKAGNKLTTSSAVTQQTRNWRVQFLNESPGTPIRLEDTGKQLFDPNTLEGLQVHHEIGMSELAPYTDKSIQRLLSRNQRIRNRGKREWQSFKKWAKETNTILGDKLENYHGLIRNQHINLPGSAHIIRGEQGQLYSTKSSGGSAFDTTPKEFLKYLEEGQEAPPVRNTQKRLNRLKREGFNLKSKLTDPARYIWDELGHYLDTVRPSAKKAAIIARQLRNPGDPNRVSKPGPAALESRALQRKIIQAIQDTAGDAQGRLDDVELQARNWINKLKFGDVFEKGVDTRGMGFNASLLGVPITAQTLDKGLGIIDLLLPSKETVAKVKKEGITQESATSYGKDLVSAGTTYGAIRGILGTAAKIKPLVPYIGKGMSIFSSVPGVVAGSVLTINEVDNRLFDGMGKKVLDEIRPDIPFHELGREQFEKNKEKSNLSEFAMPF